MPRSPCSAAPSRRLTDYLTRELCPAMGLRPVFEEIALPEYGSRDGLLLVRPSEGRPFALRAVESPARAEGLTRIHALADSLGIPAAKMMRAEVSRDHFRRHGFGVIVEEWIPGRHLRRESAGPAEAAQLGEALGSLHRVEGACWGGPANPQSRPYFEAAVQAKARRSLDAAAKFDPAFPAGWRARAAAVLRAGSKVFAGLPPFRLLHGRIDPGNVIFTPGGAARFVDLESVVFGAPEADLAAVRHYFCSLPENEASFDAAYAAARGLREGAEVPAPAGSLALHRLIFHLHRWASRARSLAKANLKGAPGDAGAGENLRAEREAFGHWLVRAAANQG